MIKDIVIGLLMLTTCGFAAWVFVLKDQLEQRTNYGRRLEREIQHLKFTRKNPRNFRAKLH